MFVYHRYVRRSRAGLPFVFFFQAEDGIRDATVTGVQTCALPISGPRSRRNRESRPAAAMGAGRPARAADSARACAPRSCEPRARSCPSFAWKVAAEEIGRASCRKEGG